MKFPTSCIWLLPILILSAAPAYGAMETAQSCFESNGGYYNFGEAVKLQNFQADKAAYNAGEDVMLDFRITGNQIAPIAEGFTRFQVFYNDPSQGEQMIDEFFGETKKGTIYLRKGDIYSSRVKWKIPVSAKPGEYTMKVYFLSDESMNLAGLSFVPFGPPGVPAAGTKFTVNSNGNAQYIYFDKEKTWLSGSLYEFSTFNPSLDPDADVSVTTEIANEGTAKQVDVTAEIYEWDDVTGKAMSQYTVMKETSVQENGRQRFVFNVGRLPAGAYEIRIAAQSAGEKAILKLRFAMPGEKARIIYAGLSDYPLVPGREYTAFICFSNSADRSTTTVTSGTFDLSQNLNTVFSDSFDGLEVGGAPTLVKATFTPAETVSDSRAVIKLFNKDKQLVDQVTLSYDYSRFYPAGGDFSLSLTPSGTGVSYTVAYKDTNGIPLKGSLLVYLVGKDGSVADTHEGISFTGEYSGSFEKAESGSKVIARELTHDLKAEQTMALSPAGRSGTDGTQKKEADGSGLLLPAIAAIVILAAALLFFKGRKK